jgi:hypothetical protein
MAAEDAPRDGNFVPATLFQIDGAARGQLMSGHIDQATGRILVESASGSVSTVSVATANGFAGTVATPTTTPVITLSTTITGILKGNGTAISAATAGTDYSAGTSALGTGILKTTTATGALTVAVAADFPTLNQNTTGSAATLTTPRTIGTATGDVTSAGSTFDGSANNTNALTLATVNSNVGSFGSATQVGTFTVNGKGLITAASNTTVTPAVGSITGLGTGVATFLGTPTSANLAAAITDETGSGALMFGTSPTITTSILAAANTANIGSTTTGWAHLYMTSGGVLDFANGDYTLTHSTGILTANKDFRITTVGSNAASVPTLGSTSTLTNKRRTRRSASTAGPGATPSTNTDNVDLQIFTALAAAITSMSTNLTGTPSTGDFLEFWFTDNGTARAITWGASFASTTVSLPTTTVISTKLRVLFEWGGSTWDCVAVA